MPPSAAANAPPALTARLDHAADRLASDLGVGRHEAAASTAVGVPPHRCSAMEAVCLWNDSIVPLDDRPQNLSWMAWGVESPVWSHHSKPFGSFVRMRPRPRPDSLAGAMLRNLSSTRSPQTMRTALVWVPTFAFNFGEHFINSVVPLHELLDAGVLDPSTFVLRPELYGRRVPSWYESLHAGLSSTVTQSVRRVAPKCASGSATCAGECYSRLVLCNFQGNLNRDLTAHPFSPWRVGQRIAAHHIANAPSPDRSSSIYTSQGTPPAPPSRGRRDAPERIRVVFVQRGATEGRTIVNLAAVLAACNSPSSCLRCANHTFGVSMAADVRVAAAADVLVGMHGSGLTNGFFLRRGAAIVEVRQLGFWGSWPDRYYATQAQVERGWPLQYFQVVIGDPSLNVPAYDASTLQRPLSPFSVWHSGVRLPWHSLVHALRMFRALKGSEHRGRRWVLQERRFIATDNGTRLLPSACSLPGGAPPPRRCMAGDLVANSRTHSSATCTPARTWLVNTEPVWPFGPLDGAAG